MPDKLVRTLLSADALINLVLGILLIISPVTLFEIFGIPIPVEPFYARILGAVLLGIGLALALERYKSRYGFSGLGLGGAILINFCGAAALAILLVFNGLDIPLRGRIFLWSIALVILAISLFELFVVYKQANQT